MDESQWDEAARIDDAKIPQLRKLVIPYSPDKRLPPLPDVPYGVLFGVAIIFDEDRDERVLVAIDKLRETGLLSLVVAIYERKAGVTLYVRSPIWPISIEPCGDIWTIVDQYIAQDGKWVNSHAWT